MSSPQKIKGTKFERDIAEWLTNNITNSSWKRVPGSGAIGTIVGEPFLTGDINGVVDSIGKKFKVEAKVGYGGEKQFALKREWLEKIKEEADASYSIPMVAGKFSGSRGSVKTFIVLESRVFADLINLITEKDLQLQEMYRSHRDTLG